MSNGKSSGSIDVKFKTERKFGVFGQDFARCYANLEVGGKMEKPVVVGDKTYRIDFHLDTGCDTVLKNFKIAYDKTFEKTITFPLSAFGDYVRQTAYKLEINDADFTASLTTCGVKPKLLPAEQITRAKDYFRTGLKEGPVAGEDPPYIDSDGLIQFIVAGELVSDPVIMKKITELKDVLIALTSIVTGYINDEYPNDPSKRKDPLVWLDVMGNLPLMGPFKYEEQSYTRAIRGVKIAKEFIDFIMDIVTSEGDALKSFKDFLEKQGEAINFGIENNQDGYKTVTAGVAVEAFKVGGETVYVPKLKMYAIHFNRTNSSFTSACASVEIIDIDFMYQNTTSVFDYQALQDSIVKKEFDDFLRMTRKAQIGKATTFFNKNFSKNPSPPSS